MNDWLPWLGWGCVGICLIPAVTFLIARFWAYGYQCGIRAFEELKSKKSTYRWRKD